MSTWITLHFLKPLGSHILESQPNFLKLRALKGLNKEVRVRFSDLSVEMLGS